MTRCWACRSAATVGPRRKWACSWCPIPAVRAVGPGIYGPRVVAHLVHERAGHVHQRQRFDVSAHKPMEVDLHGIRLGQTEVEVYNQMRLRDVRTDFDGIPLVGPLGEQRGADAARSKSGRN